MTSAAVHPSLGLDTAGLAFGQVAVLAVLAMLGDEQARPLRVAPGCSGRSLACGSLRRTQFLRAKDGRMPLAEAFCSRPDEPERSWRNQANDFACRARVSTPRGEK